MGTSGEKRKILYFDSMTGISGDMTLGAFIDLGVPLKWLKQQLLTMPLPEFDLSASTVKKGQIVATGVEIRTVEKQKSRHYADIKTMIEKAPFSRNVKEMSLEMFRRLAHAEANIHGTSIETVHFHEVGALDAIVDMVGTSLCVEYIGAETIMASKIPLGSGYIECDHGTLPVPAPATLAILKGVPVFGLGVAQELVTPTGAAIITTLAGSYQPLPDMTVRRIGYGAGKRDLSPLANVLRIIEGSSPRAEGDLLEKTLTDRIVIIETCIDDMNPEIFGHIMERLFHDGALDVYWVPVHMKKNRPGTWLQVLAPLEKEKILVQRLFNETTTTGIRHYRVTRTLLARKAVEIDTVYGRMRVKRITDLDGKHRLAPEYETCRKIALEKDVPIQTVLSTVAKAVEAFADDL